MPADDISSEIVIRRMRYAGARGLWRVRLDGQNVGRLAHGESLTFRASPGSHTIEVRSGAGSSSGTFQFDAEAGGRIELVTAANGTTPITTKILRLTKERTRTPAVEIVIKRVGLFGSWQVLLDGQDVGRLAKGVTSLTRRVSPGSHAVVFDSVSRWQIIRSARFQFDAEEGERIELGVQLTGSIGVWCSAASTTPRPGTDSQSAAATTRVVRHLDRPELLRGVGKRLPSTRNRVFVCYSHADDAWIQRLLVHLGPLYKESLVDVWADKRIRPGDDWRAEIDTALAEARFAVLLVSAAFYNSAFIGDVELPALLAASGVGGCRVIPLLVSASRFARDPALSRFQAVPSNGRTLAAMTAEEVEQVLADLAAAIEDEIRGPAN